jgi:hypothetical protein
VRESGREEDNVEEQVIARKNGRRWKRKGQNVRNAFRGGVEEKLTLLIPQSLHLIQTFVVIRWSFFVMLFMSDVDHLWELFATFQQFDVIHTFETLRFATAQMQRGEQSFLFWGIGFSRHKTNNITIWSVTGFGKAFNCQLSPRATALRNGLELPEKTVRK